MISFPPSSIAQIDSAIQQARGAAASVLGQSYDVRRLSDTTNDSISANTPVISGFQARIRRITSRTAIENEIFGLIAYEAICNNTALEIGDTLTETGYEAMQGAVYTFAQRRPTRETILMSTPFNVFVSRPMPSAGAASQQPTSGPVFTTGYGGITKAGEEILVLKDGMYEFQSAAEFIANGSTAAGIQAGLQPTRRAKEPSVPKLPTVLPEPEYLIYLPLLPGEQVIENDIINFGNCDRYKAQSVYMSDQTGLVGYIIIAQKRAD